MAKKQYNVKTSAVAATERRARKYGVAGGSGGSGTYIDIAGDVAGKLDRDVFESMFERVVTGTDDEGNETWYILAKAALVSVGDITAYGYGGTSGSAPGSGVTELRCLDDVILTDPKAGQILKYNGSHWVNAAADAGLDETALAAYLATNHYAKTSDIPSLVGYATQTWVDGKSYATEAWVNAKGYLTQHQDISHLLTREEFEAMFERVDMDNSQWYILAKSHLASVGDITAYGTGGPGSTLGGIGDVTLGSLAAGDVIMWDGQKWVNGQAPGGGLDESQLAAYLTANNYITQADLGNYVTVDGEQTITGRKTFGAGLLIANQAAIAFANPAAVSLDIYGNLYRNSQDATNWSIFDTGMTSKILDVDMRTGDLLITGKFIKSGGTSSQFLKADGSVDGNTYLAYLPQNGGLKSQIWPDTWGCSVGSIVAEFTDSSGSSAFKFKKDNPSAGKMSMIIDGTVYINEGMEAVASQAWAVNKAGDTMTGALRVPSIELTTISGIKFTDNILGGSGDVAKMYITGTGEAQQLTFEVQNDADDIINFITPDNNGLKKNGNTIWHAGNDGSGSGLDADLWDGAHLGEFLLKKVYYLDLTGLSTENFYPVIFGYSVYELDCEIHSQSLSGAASYNQNILHFLLTSAGWSDTPPRFCVISSGNYDNGEITIGAVGRGDQYGNRCVWLRGGMAYNVISNFAPTLHASGYTYYTETYSVGTSLSGGYNANVSIIWRNDDSGRSQNQIATLQSNVASASKLQTARTLYITSYNDYRAGDGVAFDGTGDITLKLPNSITASDWFRSYGATGWHNETYGGGIYMEDTTWVRTWRYKAFYTGGGQIRTDNSFQRGGYGGNSWNNGYGALNVDIYDNVNQTPLLVAVRPGAAYDTTGANRLFAMELLNSGTQLNFGFGGAAKFYFYSGGTFVATGDVTAYSDARLKSDIRPLTNRGFVEPKTYIKDGKRCIGFLAQDVRAIYPELVAETGGADNWLALNYGNLVAVLEAQIIDHEDRIKRLEERI